MARKPDDQVGRSEGPAAGGGHQTPAQEALTAPGGHGRSDAERARDWPKGDEAGRPPVAPGGSSQGQADRMPAGKTSRPERPADNPAVTPGHRHPS